MTTRTTTVQTLNSPSLLKRAAITAALLASGAMVGCAGSGSATLGGSSGAGAGTDTGADAGIGGGSLPPAFSRVFTPGGNTDALATTGDIAANAAGVLTTAGELVASAGTALAGASLPGGANGVTAGLGAILQNTGQGVVALGQSTSDGLGQIGQNADEVGTTLRGSSPLLEKAGNAVSSTGQTVQALDDGALRIVRPVTDPVGALVDRTGQAVTSLGTKVGDGLDSGVVRRVTASSSRVITPVADTLVSTTQAVGHTTRLGRPVDGIVRRVGYGVEGVGDGIVQRAPDTPVVTETGQLVGAVGGTVASLGGVVNASGSSSGVGNGLGPVLQPVGNLVNGLVGGPAGGSGAGIGLGLGMGAGLGLGASGAGNTGNAGLLSPVTNAVGGVLAGVGTAVNR